VETWDILSVLVFHGRSEVFSGAGASVRVPPGPRWVGCRDNSLSRTLASYIAVASLPLVSCSSATSSNHNWNEPSRTVCLLAVLAGLVFESSPLYYTLFLPSDSYRRSLVLQGYGNPILCRTHATNTGKLVAAGPHSCFPPGTLIPLDCRPPTDTPHYTNRRPNHSSHMRLGPKT